MMHDRELTMTASAFKAQCLEVMSRIASQKIARVTVTKRGKPIAVMGPVAQNAVYDELADAAPPKSWGAMRGTVEFPDDVLPEQFWRSLNDVEMPEPDLSKFDKLIKRS